MVKKDRTPWNRGKKMSLAQRKKLSIAHTGKILSATHRKNIGLSLEKAYTDGVREPVRLIGNKNPNWRGNKAKYPTLHTWVRKHLGRPSKCLRCGRKNKNGHSIIGWANRDHKYSRNLKHYIPLCTPCHRKYDKLLVENHDTVSTR